MRRLHAHLTAGFPYRFRITVADNASTDGTLAAARRLAAELAEVRVVHLPEKGRGRALRAVWSASGAPVLAYLDVDLSTDLAALAPLVAPLLSGHSTWPSAPGCTAGRGWCAEPSGRSSPAATTCCCAPGSAPSRRTCSPCC